MLISAYEFARHHIPLELAKRFELTEKIQKSSTIRSGQTLLGIEIVHKEDGSYPIVKTHSIHVIGFCDQGLFDGNVTRPSKKVRYYKEHPIVPSLIDDLYPRLSTYRKEQKILGWSHYEPPSMIARSLTDTNTPYMLLQSHDTLDEGLSWKNGSTEITWFALQATPELNLEELTTFNPSAPSSIERERQIQDHFAGRICVFRNLRVGGALRVHHLQRGDCVALSGAVITTHNNGSNPPKALLEDGVYMGRVVGFAKADAPFYLQPETFQELQQRMCRRTKVQMYDRKRDALRTKMLTGLRWGEQRRDLLGTVDITQCFVRGTWPFYPSWDDIPQELLERQGGISDYAPKIVLLLEDLYTTEMMSPIEVHIPSLRTQDGNHPFDMFALYDIMKGKCCSYCSKSYPEIDFEHVDDTHCRVCHKQHEAYEFVSNALHPLLAIMVHDVVFDQELDESGLYVEVRFGDTSMQEYIQHLDDGFVRQGAEWMDEMDGDFAFACENGGQVRRYVSKEHRATLQLVYDHAEGMHAKLWVELVEDHAADMRGAQ